MSQLRTYRVLPLLVGLALLFGAAAPAVQAACAIMPSETQEASVPCHGHEAPVVPLVNLQKANGPNGAHPAASYHLCCQPDGPVPAIVLSDVAPRALGPAVAGVLINGVPHASVQPSAVRYTRARASAFTSSTHRQALLATFLI